MKTIRNIGTLPTSTRRLTLGGVPLMLRLQWLPRLGQWSLSVLTPTGDGIVQGVRLVCDTALLSRGNQPGMPTGALVCIDTQADGPDPLDVVGRDDLSSGRVVMLWLEPGDVVPSSTPDPATLTAVSVEVA